MKGTRLFQALTVSASIFTAEAVPHGPNELQRRDDTAGGAAVAGAAAGLQAPGSKPPDGAVGIASKSIPKYIKKCSKDQKKMINEAWDEAGKLAAAHQKWEPPGWIWGGGSFQPAQSMYLGDHTKDNPWFGTNWQKTVRENMDRQTKIHEDGGPWYTYVYMYCDESAVPKTPESPEDPQCDKPNNPGKSVIAYTFDDLGTFWSNHYVVFCPQFFNTTKLSSLQEKVDKAQKNDYLKQYINEWRAPKCDLMPERYLPKDVVQLAKDENIETTRLNAESWAQAAMAMFIQQTLGLKDGNPPVPAPDDAAAAEDDLEEKFLSAPPDGFLPPIDANVANPTIDMTDVEALNDDSAPPPSPRTWTLGGDQPTATPVPSGGVTAGG